MVEHILKTIPSPLHESANRAGRTPQHLAAFLGSAVRKEGTCAPLSLLLPFIIVSSASPLLVAAV